MKINLRTVSNVLSPGEMKLSKGGWDPPSLDGGSGYCLTSKGKKGSCSSDADCVRKYGEGICEFLA